MDVVSTSPLRVASIVWRPRAGAWALTIVCKATFRLEPGVCVLADAQEDPTDGDAFWSDAPARSLRATDDLVPFKPRADVLLIGHAFAPGGQSARVLPVRMMVGEIDKSVEVWCDRIFWQDGRVLEGQPFSRMELRYERAAFGPANPVGVRFDAPPDAHGAVRIPNLQPAGLRVAGRADTFGPIGFGPIAPTWPARSAKLRRNAEGWSARGWREQPLPSDIDAGYFNAAPPDQQVDTIEGDERIVLENLHAEHARLETRLPGLRPAARMVSGGRAGEGITLVADTLNIDTDRGLVTVVWRGRVPLGSPQEEGRVVVSTEGAQAGDASDGTVLLGGEGSADATMALGRSTGARGPVTPFAGVPAEPGTMLGVRGGGPALPFGTAKSPWSGGGAPERTVARAASAPAETGTLYGVRSPAREALPFPIEGPRAAIPAPLPFEPATVQPPQGPLPEEPALLGPLARMDVEAPESPVPTASLAPAEATSTAPPTTDLPIERCAAITASLERRPAETASILEAQRLDPAAWTAISRRWSDAVRTEIGRGKTGLLRAFDAAYLAQIEQERGPIQVEEYARLVIEAERGNVKEALAAMALPGGAMIRIQRAWLAKIAGDPGLGKSVKRAITAAREAG
jgi:hypothetical protein